MPLLVDYGQSVQNSLNQLGTWLPKLVGALLILVIGYVIARIVAKVVVRALVRLGADKALSSNQSLGGLRDQHLPGMRPSSLIGTVAFWFIFAMAILAAVSALGITALSNAVASITAYIPNVIAALLILVVAIAVAGAVGALAQRMMGGTMLGKVVQTVVPTLVITIALFMALVQLKIATQIVVATYVLALGAVALGFALAFGLGGREVAGRMLMSAYESGQEKLPQMRAEMAQAKAQAASDAETIKQQAQAPAPSMDETEAVPPVPGSHRL
jgi:Mechanosensitive ion channel, conserved TM helix